jgi:hypothetical protein
MRFLKWLIVALIAVAIALALERALRSETSAAAFPQDPARNRRDREAGVVYRLVLQNERMAAMPSAPAFQASVTSVSIMPPMA